jgi:EAL domain-containing protein (putative c-di-GMP-specific phosphodiesterase class I)
VLAGIAEGMETVEQKQFFNLCGCHGYHGYLSGKPMLPDNFGIRRASDRIECRAHKPAAGKPATIQ